MRHPLVAVIALVLACAGVDAAAARANLWFRDADPALPAQALALWAGYAALLGPAIVVLTRILRRREPGARAPWVGVTAACLLVPLAAHGQLDSHFGLSADMGALKAPGPWLRVLAAAGVAAAVAFALQAGARRAPRVTVAALVLIGAAGAAHDPEPLPAPSAPEAAAPADAPNVLLLVWDTTRARSLDLYGRERSTAPALTRLGAGARVFDRARSTSVFTLTSHLSMLTGTYPSHHGASLTRQTYDPERTPSVARMLRDAGYRTGAFVGTSVLRGDTGVCDGFDVYDDRVDPDVTRTRLWAMVHDAQTIAASLVPALGRNGRPHWFETFDAPATSVLPRALRWIEQDDPRPWFCFVNLYDVHWPYLPSEAASEQLVAPYDGRVDGYLFRSDSYEQRSERKGGALTDEDNAHLVDLYEAELLDLDAQVDAFWRDLGALGSGRGLGAVITADHGEAFGEGGRYKHDDVLEVQVQVPLLVVDPEGTGGARLDGAVSGVDVAPTLLGLAGLETPPWMPGVDLRSAEPSPDRVVLVEDRDRLDVGSMRHAVYREPWKLVVQGRDADGDAALFDLRVDDVGLEDVSDRHPEVVAELRRALEDLRDSWGADENRADDWGDGGGLADHLRALGYGGR